MLLFSNKKLSVNGRHFFLKLVSAPSLYGVSAVFFFMKQFVFVFVTLLFLPLALAQVHEESHDHHDSMQDEQRDWTSILFTLFSALFIIGGIIFFFRGLEGKDLLEYNMLKRLLKSRLYPAILQIPTLVFFAFIIYYFFFGSLSYSKNPGSILAWTLWWPLVPLTFILFGRIWCTVCPLPAIGDFLQKFIHPQRKPGQFLMKYGIWITDGIFIAITLFDRLYGMVDTPWLSGVVFLLLLFGIIVISVRYERRTFCKYLCFLGGVSGNYSMVSGISIESKDKTVCASCKVKGCYFGSGSTEGCPFFNVIPSKIGMRNCTWCAQCMKNCPKDNIALRVRGIASELWSHARVSFSESFFAKLMVGVVIIQNLGMLAIWSNLTGWLLELGVGEKGAIAILYAGAIALPLLLMTLSSKISSLLQSTPSSTIDNFAAFGYAFIPIDVAGHVAHNLFHLLAEGKSIIGAFSGLFTGTVAFDGPITNSLVISGLQLAFIIAGGLGTLLVAYKIARARENNWKAAIRVVLPHAFLLVIIFGVNLVLFSTPMAHRGG